MSDFIQLRRGAVLRVDARAVAELDQVNAAIDRIAGESDRKDRKVVITWVARLLVAAFFVALIVVVAEAAQR